MNNADNDRREFTTLYAEVAGPIGHLVLNRPSRLNAINDKLLSDMLEAIHWFDQHDELRVVIFKGAGRAFCAGADLKELPFAESRPVGGNSWLRRRKAGQTGTRLCEAIEGMRAVTIAQVHGSAVGGGVLFMICCDLRLVAPDTIMFIPEIELGTNYSWGAIPRMVREIGPALTKELVITCRRFTADEAFQWRWINRVVPVAQLEEEAEKLAAEVARMPSVPTAMTKDHINAITRVMGAGLTSYNDADIAMAMPSEKESQTAAHVYAESKVGKNRRPK
ncbi:MAG TPA: enoyl-CoA hydratase/isomerase family protein [Candidatus Binataceae bacterium]|nr:enoyl-CoA hydratase/isomerase family protein [Candidatus Binataceae bacterium]